MVSQGKNSWGAGGNRTIRDCDPTAHAEIVAPARSGQGREGNYRLSGTTLYVTP